MAPKDPSSTAFSVRRMPSSESPTHRLTPTGEPKKAPKPKPPRPPASQAPSAQAAASSNVPLWGAGSCLQCGRPVPPASDGVWLGPLKVAVCDTCSWPIRDMADAASSITDAVSRVARFFQGLTK
jgi:hypothetical protein